MWIIAVIIGLIVAAWGVIGIIGLYYRLTSVTCKSTKRLNGKTVLVTGGTAGIGLAIAEEFARRGARVIVACPFPGEGGDARDLIVRQTNNTNVSFKLLDLASLTSVRTFAEDILQTEQRLDILVNNAGVLGPNVITPDGFNFVIQVNYLGPFLLTILLLPLLKKTGTNEEIARIINTSSMAHNLVNMNIDRIRMTSMTSYGDSKLWVAMFTRELAKRLEDSPVVVNTSDPAVACTSILSSAYGYNLQYIEKMFRHVYPSTWHGAQTTLHIALDDKAGEQSGEYFFKCKPDRANRHAYDDRLLQLLWTETVKFVHLSKSDLNCFEQISRRTLEERLE